MKCVSILVILLVLYHVSFIVAHPTGDGETKFSLNVHGPEGAKLSGDFKVETISEDGVEDVGKGEEDDINTRVRNFEERMANNEKKFAAMEETATRNGKMLTDFSDRVPKMEKQLVKVWKLGAFKDKLGSMAGALNGKGSMIEQMALITTGMEAMWCAAGVQDPILIPDDRLTASGILNGARANNGPKIGRLFGTTGAGAWKPQINDTNQWIQVNLGEDVEIHGVATQGAQQEEENYVTTYSVKYRASNDTVFVDVTDESNKKQVFDGNYDANTPVINRFHTPVTGQYFRIKPVTYSKDIALRFELLTC